MEDSPGTLVQIEPIDLVLRVVRIKQTDLHSRRNAGVDRKVDAAPIEVCSTRKGLAWANDAHASCTKEERGE
jgi:hypothetical protein